MVNICPPQTSWEMSMWRFHSTCQAKISHQSPWIIWKNVEVMFAGNIPKNILVAWDFSSLAQTIPEKKLHFYSSGEFHWRMKSGKFCPWFYLRLYVFQIWADIQWHPSVATGLSSNSLMAPSLGHWLSSVAIVGEMMPYLVKWCHIAAILDLKESGITLSIPDKPEDSSSRFHTHCLIRHIWRDDLADHLWAVAVVEFWKFAQNFVHKNAWWITMDSICSSFTERSCISSWIRRLAQICDH